MHRASSLFLLVVSCIHFSFCSAEDKQRVPQRGSGGISGRVSSQFVSGIAGATVYLFTVEQSSRIQNLREKAREVMRVRAEDSVTVTNAVAGFYDQMADLVPRLPRVAKMKTNSKGTYNFQRVSAGKKYQVVFMDIGEDGVHFGAVTTPTVKPGQDLQIHLSDGVW